MNKDNEKKQILLRVSQSTWDEINKWAEDELRSVNAQIEYILVQQIQLRRKKILEEE